MRSLYAIIIFLVCWMPAVTQVVVTGHVFAEVIEGLEVTEQNSLNFGKFSVSDEGGSITISPSGNVSSYGGVTVVPGNTYSAIFRINGQKNTSFTVSIPKDEIILTNGKDGKLLVTDWIIQDGKTGFKMTEKTETISLGATLVVKNKDMAPKGLYSGSYSIKFNYN